MLAPVVDKLLPSRVQDGLIEVSTFVTNFNIAKKYCEGLREDSFHELAREKLTNKNKTLDEWKKQKGYPQDGLSTSRTNQTPLYRCERAINSSL
jgi:hypothetical protein